MSQRSRYIKKNLTPKPEQVETPVERGQMLQWWLEKEDVFQDDFARMSHIALSTLNLYLGGKLDIAKMKQGTVEKLLGQMEVSDTEAWEMFNIPEEKRKTFRTFRPPPMGHGEDVRKLVELRLKVPLKGDYSAPVDAMLQYDPARKNTGTVVVEMSDGRLHTMPAQDAGKSKVLGQFISVSEKEKEKDPT